MSNNRIVVGVDGSLGARSALLWAVDECRLRRASLFVAHAPDPTDAAVVGAYGEAALRAIDDFGARMLSELVATASAHQPGVPVASLLSHSNAGDALIDLSQDSDLIVVGTRGRGGIVTSMLGSVSHRVAAHAHCPVVVVPQHASLTSGHGRNQVVVGVSHGSSGLAALEFAFEEAWVRRVPLTAVRSTADAKPRDAEQAEFDLQRLADRFPEVEIHVELREQEPADALLSAADRAQLVVVGCHHSDDRWSTRLGPVPSAIVYRAGCPVVIVGRAHSAGPALSMNLRSRASNA
jgi:nucleotide-binding universal stress UspA family protein